VSTTNVKAEHATGMTLSDLAEQIDEQMQAGLPRDDLKVMVEVQPAGTPGRQQPGLAPVHGIRWEDGKMVLVLDWFGVTR
jgi:hypothetical protein